MCVIKKSPVERKLQQRRKGTKVKWWEKCSPDAELQQFNQTTQYTVGNAGIMFVVDVIMDGFDHTTNIFDNSKTAQQRFLSAP